MATKYCDRAFISVNGARIADLVRADLRRNFNARPVRTMTPDGFNRGYVEGNQDIDISLEIAVQNQLSRPKLEAIDYENNDVQVTWIAGQELFTATGVFRKGVSDGASGVGEEVRTTFELGALKVTDGVGNSSLFSLSLS